MAWGQKKGYEEAEGKFTKEHEETVRAAAHVHQLESDGFSYMTGQS